MKLSFVFVIVKLVVVILINNENNIKNGYLI